MTGGLDTVTHTRRDHQIHQQPQQGARVPQSDLHQVRSGQARGALSPLGFRCTQRSLPQQANAGGRPARGVVPSLSLSLSLSLSPSPRERRWRRSLPSRVKTSAGRHLKVRTAAGQCLVHTHTRSAHTNTTLLQPSSEPGHARGEFPSRRTLACTHLHRDPPSSQCLASQPLLAVLAGSRGDYTRVALC
jgi:hypothetical protein